LAPALRDALRTEFGFPFPGICVLGNDTDMPSGCALILIEEVPELMFEIGGDDVLVDATVEGLAALRINSRPHVHPATGQTLARIAAADRAAAQSAGLTTWDAAEYLFLVLHAVLWRMASSFLDIDVTHHLVDSLEGMAPDRVNEIVPNIMSWFELTDVLQHLVDEEISIGDMRCILDVLSQRESKMIDTAALTERVRHAMCRQITAKFAPGRSSLPVFLLDPEIDVLVSRAIQRTAVGPYLALEPQLADDLLAAIRVQVRSLGLRAAGVPILVTAVEIRRFIRNLVSVEFPAVHVLSRQDLEPDTPIQAVARISLGSAADDASLTNQGTSA
jgi:type III secretion protein V